MPRQSTAAAKNGEALVKEYCKTKSQSIKEMVVRAYAPLVKYIVGRINISPSSTLRRDDLYQFGVIGLLEALERFDPEKNVTFKTFAHRRINGEVIDAIRREGSMSRDKVEKLKLIEKTTNALISELGREPMPFEVYGRLNMDEDEYYSVLHASQINYTVSLDKTMLGGDGEKIYRSETIEDPTAISVDEDLSRESMKSELKNIIQDLPEKQRIILALYFYEELTLSDIGQVLSLTESRVSQILNQVLVEVKAKLI